MKADIGGASRDPLGAAIQACRRHFVFAAIFSALLNVLYLAPSLYMLQVYDRVVPTRGVLTLVFLTLVFVVALSTLSALDQLRTRLLTRASLRLDRVLSGRIISAILSRSGPARNSEILREFDLLRQTMTGPGVLALLDAPWTPIYIAICFLLHPALGALALTGSLILLLLAALNERSTKQPLQKANESGARAYYGLDQSAAATGVIRALGMRRAMVWRHLDARSTSTGLHAEASFASATYMTLTKFFRLLLQSLSLGLGAYLAIEQQISAGAIFAASLLVTRALAPIEQIVGAWKPVLQGRVAYRKLKELFEAVGPDRRHTLLPAPQGAVQLENVSVATPARDRLILNKIEFALEPGASLGVIGPSGAGKSTLARVIAGALEPAQGAVRFDGAEARDWDEEQLASHIGYVPQEPTLFQGTVKENISRFQTQTVADASEVDAGVVAAAQACGAHDFIVRLPNGYDTVLGPNGAGLSAGQAQRIALARAFYGSPKVIIMDEPNAHLDADGETALIAAVERMKEEQVTVIIVAHRTSILQSVDRLMVIADGRIQMLGPRDAVQRRLTQPRNLPAQQPAPAAAE